MTERSLKWEAKIRFFSKFLGYESDDFEETVAEVPKPELSKKQSKGIRVVQHPSPHHSLAEHSQELEKEWLNLTKTPYRLSTR
jgi:hypothetical protein